jgi:hypothetical protein
MMAWQDQKRKLRRRSNSDRWITHPEFPMAVRSELRQEECAEEENRSQASDLSVKTNCHWIHKKEHDLYMQDEAGLQNPESRRTIHLQEGHVASD